jgi:hypothetical protein
MRRPALIATVLVLCLAGGAALFLWRDAPAPAAIAPDDLTALRMQATDLQRAVETLARSDSPDPAALSALADRLEALTQRLDQLQGLPPP